MGTNIKVIKFSFLVVAIGIGITLTVMHPIWSLFKLHIPGEPGFFIDYTQPVDSAFYIRNAELGYRWVKSEWTSLWFHPLVSWLLIFPSKVIPTNQQLWLISIFSAFLSLILIYKYTQQIAMLEVHPKLLLATLVIPGCLGMATGNAEFPCLLFTSLLMMNIISKQNVWLSALWGCLAILTKPNALYMIPALLVYLIYSIYDKDQKATYSSLAGIAGISLSWYVWVYFVDSQVGESGAYWQARQVCSVPLDVGLFSLLYRTAKAIIYGSFGEGLKFLTALIIPIIHMWILLVIPFKQERHRIAILSSILSMLIITFLINNPNKIIVYSTTIPGYITCGMLFLQQSFQVHQIENATIKILRRSSGLLYIFFCVIMAIFFILGTPLEWYY